MFLIPKTNNGNEFERFFCVDVCGNNNSNTQYCYLLNKGTITEFIAAFCKVAKLEFDFDLSIGNYQHGNSIHILKNIVFFGENEISKILQDNGDIQLTDLFRSQNHNDCCYGLHIHQCACKLCEKARLRDKARTRSERKNMSSNTKSNTKKHILKKKHEIGSYKQCLGTPSCVVDSQTKPKKLDDGNRLTFYARINK